MEAENVRSVQTPVSVQWRRPERKEAHWYLQQHRDAAAVGGLIQTHGRAQWRLTRTRASGTRASTRSKISRRKELIWNYSLSRLEFSRGVNLHIVKWSKRRLLFGLTKERCLETFWTEEKRWVGQADIGWLIIIKLNKDLIIHYAVTSLFRRIFVVYKKKCYFKIHIRIYIVIVTW